MLGFHIAEKRIYPPQKQKEREVETKQFQSDDDDDYDAQIQEEKFERPKKRCFQRNIIDFIFNNDNNLVSLYKKRRLNKECV